MSKIVFTDFSSSGGLTVGKLKEILNNYPDDMKITVKTLSEHFPAKIIEEGEYNLYPVGCNGIAQGKGNCLKIE